MSSLRHKQCTPWGHPCMKIRLITLLLGLAACSPAPLPGPGPSPSTPTSSISPTSPPSASSSPVPDLKTGNLIANPGAEIAVGSRPADWSSDSWGELKAELSWRQDTPYSGQRYLSTRVSEYGGEGDAKWSFEPVSLRGGKWYEYRDQYRSDGRSRQIYACQPPGGTRRFYNASQSHVNQGWHESVFRFYLPSDCDVTVMHLLDRNGFLDTDHHQLRQVDAAPLNQAMVSVSFDDIWKTAYTLGASELEARGFKGSFYITRLYTEQPGEKYANLNDVKDLIKRGHELGSHSHRHAAMSEMEQPALLEDIRKSTVLLKDLGVSEIGIAYPFGDFNGSVETEVQRFHSYARTSLAGLNDKTSNRYRLRIVPVTSETSTESLLSWIQSAAETRTWLILLFHDLGEPIPQSPYTTSFTQYLEVLDELKRREAEIKVVTVEQGLKAAGL
ncbi:MAG: hypothetical protein CVV27_11420 [Candidatus Melainabacteria bacterium HGW-Melainabacteria-1]|nr:MAG: hypothetical protein CVV27_11420 [Candidatus Melainabacteria bacterium HGW-Melainabacteria-1]